MCCGILIDKIGVRRVIIISWILALIGLTIIVYSCSISDYLTLCIGRVIVGIGNEGLSMTIKLYAIEFFASNEYGIVFGIYLAFVSFGGGLNTFLSYRMYKWFNDNLVFSLLTPLFMAPLVCIPLFLLMFIEKTGILSRMVGIDENKDNEDTKLMLDNNKDTNTSIRENNRFRFSDIKQFSKYYWLLVIGVVLWAGAAQSALNIAISFIHHMFGYSYEFATWVGLFGTSINVITYLISGTMTAKIGKRMEFLLIANAVGFGGQYIYGWINTSLFWAFFGAILKGTSIGFTYPVMWACISLLVEDKLRGTAFGFATAMRFGTIAVCYIITGILTKEEDGGEKYIDVQVFLLCLIAASTVFYVILYYMDIKWNNRILQRVHAKKEAEEIGVRKEGDLSMAKIRLVTE